MRTLSSSEKRTIRLAAIVLGAAFILFAGQKICRFLAQQRASYTNLLQQVKQRRAELKPYPNRVQDIQKMMENFHMDPNTLSRTSVVAEASAAILKAATAGQVQLGPIRETAARSNSKELATMQLDCTGKIASVLAFLHRFESIGYPIIIDSVQLTAEPMKPGLLKAHLALIILDFEQWKGEEPPHA
jgi:cell division protein FtsB